MNFTKKTIIIVVSSIIGVLVIVGIIGLVAHSRHEGRGFGNGVGNVGCNRNFGKENQADMMSGLNTIIATKDYAAFQTLFSGSRMLEQVNTPEKFATRVDLQTTLQKAKDLQSQLGSGDKIPFGPMMLGSNRCKNEGGRGSMMSGRNTMRRK